MALAVDGIKKEDDNPRNKEVCTMQVAKALLICLLVTIAYESSANMITDTVKATQESLVQACDEIVASELGVACVHTWEYFQTWLAERPVQSGVAAGVITFIFCYWLSRRTTQYRSMRKQTDAYDNGFQDGYMYAFQEYKNQVIWV